MLFCSNWIVFVFIYTATVASSHYIWTVFLHIQEEDVIESVRENQHRIPVGPDAISSLLCSVLVFYYVFLSNMCIYTGFHAVEVHVQQMLVSTNWQKKTR